VEHAADGEPVRPRRVYVAPTDRHLTLDDGVIRVTRGPKESGHRPAVDPLFRSLARAYGPGAVGVMLSGALDDGAAGLRAVKSRGGIAIVQDPKDASNPGMPLSAIQNVEVDHVLPAVEIGPALEAILAAPPPPVAIAADDSGLIEGLPRSGFLPEAPLEEADAGSDIQELSGR